MKEVNSKQARAYFDVGNSSSPGLILHINALRVAHKTVNGLEFERLVEAMYDPQNNRGVSEDVMTTALAPPPLAS